MFLVSARLPNDPVAPTDLGALRGEDEALAHQALTRLWTGSRPYVLRQLSKKGVRGDEAEDVCQAAFVEIWRGRGSVRAQTQADWYGLVRRRVSWELSDRIGAREREDLALGELDVPAQDRPYLEALLSASEESRGLYGLANRMWLGDSRAKDAETGAVVVQLVLVDGVSPKVAAQIFGVAESDIDGWAADPAILARALFATLCWPSDDLAAFVLRPDRPLDLGELDAVHAGEKVPTAWNAHEARLVAWRLRNGLLEAELLRLSNGEIEPPSLSELLERVKSTFPFGTLTEALLRSLESRGMASALAEPGLWKRIAFEYAIRYELPHRQIVERAGPSAEKASFRLDEAKLNNWLSLGRIFNNLAVFAREESL